MIPILYRVGIDTMMLSRHVTSLVLNRRRCGQHKTIKTNQEGLVNGRNNTKKKKNAGQSSCGLCAMDGKC